MGTQTADLTQHLAPPKKQANARAIYIVVAMIGSAIALTFGYRWYFTPAQVQYATASVEGGDVESTIVAAGILQPLNYVDVGPLLR